MATLEAKIRRQLESRVVLARAGAEIGARKAIQELAVDRKEPWQTMTPEQRKLRNRLRAHAKQLGDLRDSAKGTQGIERLVAECAYEHWHRMLFARFLAENDLLVEPTSGVAISLEECRELAQASGVDWLTLASEFASRMLSQIFRAGDPVLEVALPPETRHELEEILHALPAAVFVADDSLGWVYQFWQAAEKERVNRSEKKIGADELPAVTQLFTEDYMVLFLLHNTLGAWWAGKRLAENPALAERAGDEEALRAACALPGVEWRYLRFVRGDDERWRPAAGTFDGWQKQARQLTLLDPCMGSGHFLVFALPILVAFRVCEEGLSTAEAVAAVLRDNLFGLEIDPRCTQIAAFNLALAAWRLGGYQALPALQLACSGLSLGVSKKEWLKLAERVAATMPLPPKRDLFGGEENLFSARLRDGFERLYDLFEKAPLIGSLIDPRAMSRDLFAAGFQDLEPVLAKALTATGDEETAEAAVAAQGMAKAAELLGRTFTLVITNVPYLGEKRQSEALKDYCGRFHSASKADLAAVFIERAFAFCETEGTIALVTKSEPLFLGQYKQFRKHLLATKKLDIVVKLGAGAFQAISGHRVNVALVIGSGINASNDALFGGIDVTGEKTPQLKTTALLFTPFLFINQLAQIRNPDARIIFEESYGKKLLGDYAHSMRGIVSGDSDHWIRCFWELPAICDGWEWLQSTTDMLRLYGGREHIIDWRSKGRGMLRPGTKNQAYGYFGVNIALMNGASCSLYTGELYDNNSGAIVPYDPNHLKAIWTFCSSEKYWQAVRRLDQKVNVTNATLVKVPFDLEYWQKVADEQYPDGLPKPFSNDPTQWLFNGHPQGAEHSLQVAVARLVGYQWPRQRGAEFPDCPALDADGLERHADEDGIVCLTPLRGETSAADRLRALLAEAYGDDWSPAKQNELLAAAGFADRSLEDWLRDGFFEKHCELFHQRPFIWHIWDGQRHGFHALINYHKLAAPNGDGRRTLEKLLYTYLGDWIERQRADQKNDIEGADLRLAAAVHLKGELENILKGEPPYDLFVRWKALGEQAIGWQPDINDGVRLNIRPFMLAKPLLPRAKTACILRVTPKRIDWKKDRGKEPLRDRADYPWFWSWDGETADFAGGVAFDGNRWNDLHYSRKAKEAARARQSDAATRTEGKEKSE